MDDGLQRDLYEERRRKWRRSGFWRGVGVVVLLGALAVGLAIWAARPGLQPHLAELRIEGLITEDDDREALLAALAEDPAVRAVVLRISSPGGTVVGSEQVFVALRALAARKPVVALMGEMAASGGLIAALAADHVIARENTLTGSVGVLVEYPDFSGLMDDLGVKVEVVRTRPLKGDPSPFRPASEAGRGALEAIAVDADAWFRAVVADRRGLSPEAVAGFADGAAFSGRRALTLGVVDAIGGLPEARVWLESRRRGLGALPLRAYGLEDDWGPLSGSGWLGRALGLAPGWNGGLGVLSHLAAPRLWAVAP